MSLTYRENKFLMHKNVIQLIHDGGHLFTGLNTSLADTESIAQGTVPANTSTNDVETIIHLKKGFQYIENHTGFLTLSLIININKLVAYDALEPGHFAQQPMLINGINYKPPKPSPKVAKAILNKYKSATKLSISLQAIYIMLEYDRHQFFWDGNKRTAWLAANYYLLQHGAGVLNISLHQNSTWNRLLSKFYESGNIIKIANWLNKNCVTRTLGKY